MGTRVGVTVLVVLVILAACSGDEPDVAPPQPSALATTTTLSTTPPTISATPPPTTAPQPTTTTSEPWPTEMDAGWDDAWAADRQAVIDRLTAGIERGDWGVGDDNILRGPGNLEIDLNDCPPDWDPNEGITDDEIVLGLVDWGRSFPPYLWNSGARSYIDLVNHGGGVAEREVSLAFFGHLTTDDSTTFVMEDIDRVEPFVVSGRVLAGELRRRVLELCYPAPANIQVLEPEETALAPFETMGVMSRTMEARLWLDHIHASSRRPSVAALTMDNMWGTTFERVFEQAAEHDPHFRFVSERHDAAAPTVSDELHRLVESDPDFIALMTAGAPCLMALQEAAALTFPQHRIMLPIVCRGPAAYLEPAGAAAHGVVSLAASPIDLRDTGTGYTTFLEERQRRDEYYDWLDNSTFGHESWGWAWLQVEFLRIAAELPGGLNRPNLLLAMWSADLRPPHHQPGVRYQLNGFDDPEPIETGTLERWDSGLGEWIPIAPQTPDH